VPLLLVNARSTKYNPNDANPNIEKYNIGLCSILPAELVTSLINKNHFNIYFNPPLELPSILPPAPRLGAVKEGK